MYQSMERSGSLGDPRISASAEPAGVTELQQFAAAFERGLKNLAELNQQMSMLRDRLFGERPTGPGDSQKGPRPVRGGMVGGLHDRADDMNAQIERLSVLVSEVSRVA